MKPAPGAAPRAIDLPWPSLYTAGLDFRPRLESLSETHFSTKPPCSRAPARIPQPHGHQEWPAGSRPPPRQGPEAPVGLIPVIPVVERLKQRREFLAVAGARHKWAAPGLVLQARRRNGIAGGPRIGFTASRKVGNAVCRNRARRRLRAIAENVMPEHAKQGYDFVLIARAATLRRPFPALLGDLKTALKKLHTWCDGEFTPTIANRQD